MFRLGSKANKKDVLTKVVSTAVRGFEAEYVEVHAQELCKTAITTKEDVLKQ